MPTLNQSACTPALIRASAMFKLTVQYGALKIAVTFPVAALVGLLLLLL
jgi:hypothetical protein